MMDLWWRFSRNGAALLGLFILLGVIGLALAAPLLYPESPFRVVGKPFLAPFSDYLFGTDVLGRDIAAGIAHGARTSLLIGFLATVVAVCVGTLIGGFAGYSQGGFACGLSLDLFNEDALQEVGVGGVFLASCRRASSRSWLLKSRRNGDAPGDVRAGRRSCPQLHEGSGREARSGPVRMQEIFGSPPEMFHAGEGNPESHGDGQMP